MRLSNVPVKGWVDLDEAYRAISALPKGLPRMMLAHGNPGLGKTTAVDWLSARERGVYMVASSTWSQRVFLQKLAGRIGVDFKKSDNSPTILDACLNRLETKQTELIVIDEFDRIVHKPGVVELIREIYDVSDCPLALVGMGQIERALKDYPQFDDRIGRRVTFGPVDLDDAAKIATQLCEVVVSDDLLTALWKRSGGVIRLLVTELAQAESMARREGLEAIGVTDMEGF